MKKKVVICGALIVLAVFAVYFIVTGRSCEVSRSEIQRVVFPLLEAQKVTFDLEIPMPAGSPQMETKGLYELPSKSCLHIGA